MLKTVLFLLSFHVFALLVVFLVLRPVYRDAKARKGVRNTDARTCNFVFVLPSSPQDALERLCRKEDDDLLGYTFYEDAMILRLDHWDVSIEYALTFHPIEGRTYLMLTRQGILHGKSNLPLLVNRFIIQKTGAVPADYRTFQAKIQEESTGENQ